MMPTSDEIVQYARTWLGVPWKHQGRSQRGVDCAGLLVMVADHFSLPYEDLMGYGRQPDGRFLEQIRKFTRPARPRRPLHGAVGVFNDSIMPCHTGIFAVDSAGRITVIHAECWPKRRVCEQPYGVGAVGDLSERLVDIRLIHGVDYVE